MIDLRCRKTHQTCNCPSWSKGSDLRPDVLRHAWVQIPHYTPHPLNSVWSECHSYKVEVASSSLAVGTIQRSSMEEYPAHNREVGGSKPPVVSRPE